MRVPARLLPGALAVLVAAPAAAQQADGAAQVIDRVVAVAGDSVVLESELAEDLLRYQAAGNPLPPDPEAREALRRDLVDQRVNELVLVQAALRDSVEVLPERLQAAVDREVAQRRRAFTTDAEFEAALAEQGLSLSEYRALLSGQLRRSLLVENYIGQVQATRTPPTIPEDEIRRFFEQSREALGERPATISFRQVVVAPEPTDSARQAALAEVAAVLEELRDGADFADVARRVSDDEGSRASGGDLGWFRQGQMLPDFERAAFSLPAGAVSGAVETAAGFHIIKVEKVRGPERQARHILIRPAISPEDQERAESLAQRIADQLRAGVPIDSLIEEHGDPSEQSRVGPYPIDQLPAPYDTALASVQADQVVGPIPLDGGMERKWAAVLVTDYSPAGPYTLDDVRTRIRERLQQQRLVEELIGELRERTFIDIRV
ncbi:MAG: peptidylprolyl isomerase [Longimicrobiales bacterium]